MTIMTPSRCKKAEFYEKTTAVRDLGNDDIYTLATTLVCDGIGDTNVTVEDTVFALSRHSSVLARSRRRIGEAMVTKCMSCPSNAYQEDNNTPVSLRGVA